VALLLYTYAPQKRAAGQMLLEMNMVLAGPPHLFVMFMLAEGDGELAEGSGLL
jgi:hypothetical protein